MIVKSAWVEREQRHAVHVGGGGDREIHRAPAGLAAAIAHRRGEAPPFAGDRGVDRQWLERRLDHAQPQASAGTLVGVLRDLHAEVELGQGRGADRALALAGLVGADQHRRVEQRAHLRERVGDLAGEPLEILGEGLGGRRVPDLAA
jgi:hypothetical protein